MIKSIPLEKTEAVKLHKNKETPLVCLTAYTAPMAKILNKHCDILLVGDSVGMVLYGMENTLGVTHDMIINHAKAVTKYAENACVVVDMPFGTYEKSKELALENAQKVMNETQCSAVKLEGGIEIAQTIEYLTSNHIPVMAHIGLQPQSVIKEGGYKIKGRNPNELQKLLSDAKVVEDAGAFAVVIEGTISTAAKQITSQSQIPTIGIGASASCDGQILVTEDLLGLNIGKLAKFVKTYENLSEKIDDAAAQYATEVKSRTFPSEKYIYQ